jgi:hypothetical protein
MRRLKPLNINISKLWDSSDDDDIEILDDHPVLSSSTTTTTATTTDSRQHGSLVPLLNNDNTGRLSLLPAFPSLHGREQLLLANVPCMYTFVYIYICMVSFFQLID